MSGRLYGFLARIRRRSLLELSPDPDRLFPGNMGENGIVVFLSSFSLFLIEAAQNIPGHEDGWNLSYVCILPNPSPSILISHSNKSVFRHTSGGLVCCLTDGGDNGKEVTLKASVCIHNHKQEGPYDGFSRAFILRLSVLSGLNGALNIEDRADLSVGLNCRRQEIVAFARFDFDSQWRSMNNHLMPSPETPLFTKFENGVWRQASSFEEVRG